MVDPLLRPSELPYELPDFGRIKEEHFLPAFEAAMALDLQCVRAVLADPDPPTFANTVEALERGGLALDRVESVFFTLTAAHNTEGIQRIYQELAPRLSKHKADFTLDKELYARVRRVDRTDLEPWQLRVLDEYVSWFANSGAELTLDDEPVATPVPSSWMRGRSRPPGIPPIPRAPESVRQLRVPTVAPAAPALHRSPRRAAAIAGLAASASAAAAIGLAVVGPGPGASASLRTPAPRAPGATAVTAVPASLAGSGLTASSLRQALQRPGR